MLIDFQSYVTDDSLREAITKLVENRPSGILVGNRFLVGSEYGHNDRYLISLFVSGIENCFEEIADNQSCDALIFAQKTDMGWDVEFINTQQLSELFDSKFSPQIVSPATPQADRPGVVQLPGSDRIENYLFPFVGEWIYWGGWHTIDGDTRAIDIGTGNPDKRVLASAKGRVTRLCKSDKGPGMLIKIDDGAQVLKYWHLNKNTLGKDTKGETIHVLSSVAQGTVLGNVLTGSFSDDGCSGWASSRGRATGIFIGLSPKIIHLQWMVGQSIIQIIPLEKMVIRDLPITPVHHQTTQSSSLLINQ